jgi:predicted NBD/HSP70 family sugar kinase
MREKYPRKTSNKPRNVKYHNKKLILSMFRGRNTLSIAEIAGRISLSKTTVTKMVNDFREKGLVLAMGKGSSTEEGGKKPELFAFNGEYASVIALVVGTNTITGAIMDLKCGIISRRVKECGPEIPYSQALEDIAAMIRGLLEDSGRGGLCPIVIGCEGIIDAWNGIIHYTMHHRWGRNLPLRKDLGEALGFPSEIYVDNNLRLAGYAELINHGDFNNFIVIITTPYSGAGSVLESQQLVRGANGFVGEFGHIIVEPYSDIRCHCGGHGCFGVLVSPDTVLAQADKLYPAYPESVLSPNAREGTLKITDVFDASNRNDHLARILMDRVIHYFAILIHNIVLLRDPEKIIIQGVYAAAGDYFLLGLREQVNRLPFYKMDRNLSIDYSSVSEIDPYLVGAGYYGVDTLLDVNSLYD